MERTAMKPRIRHLLADVPKSFDELNAIYSLRPINDRIDLENAYEIMDRLAVLDKRNRDQNDYLQMLILLTEDYDKKDIESAIQAAREVSGLQALKYLMENTNVTQADLTEILDVGASAVSMILSGNRPITADHARKLATHFAIDAGVFL
jgi:HTH-type transcriptional regulator/antitoxin HigA